jgi:predicted amidohydrolase
MPDLTVAAIQMDAQVGRVERNLARATELVEQAAAQGAELVVLPELFASGYEYTDRNFQLAEPLDGLTGAWIVDTAKRLGVHLVGSFPAQVEGQAHIVAMLASPDGRQWVYRKSHVALWENLYFERGSQPVIAGTELGRIGLMICWDQVFSDLARAYQGRVDLLCVPSSPPSWAGTLEDREGRALARLGDLRSLGNTLDGVGWFDRAQVAHAQSAGVPLVYAARCGELHSPIPYGWSFLTMLRPAEALRVLRAAGTNYLLRCPMQGRSRILDAQGRALVSAGQDGEAVLVALVQPGAPEPATLPELPRGRALIPGIPKSMLLFDDSLIVQGRWVRRRRASKNWKDRAGPGVRRTNP